MLIALTISKETSLHWAARHNNNAEVVKILIENGANIKYKNI